jgi:hypothetical protein
MLEFISEYTPRRILVFPQGVGEPQPDLIPAVALDGPRGGHGGGYPPLRLDG